MTPEANQPHEAKADELERELDDMQERSERLQDEIDSTGGDWESKKRDDRVPGAAGQPEEAEGTGPETDYPAKGGDEERGEGGDDEPDEAGDEEGR
jgi:hypothetical protein